MKNIDNFKYDDYELNFDYNGKHFCIPEDCVLQIKDLLQEIDHAYIVRQNIIDYIDEQFLDSFLGKSKKFWENFELKDNIAICKAINSMNQDYMFYNNTENNMYLDDYVDSNEGKEITEKINDAINDSKKNSNSRMGVMKKKENENFINNLENNSNKNECVISLTPYEKKFLLNEIIGNEDIERNWDTCCDEYKSILQKLGYKHEENQNNINKRNVLISFTMNINDNYADFIKNNIDKFILDKRFLKDSAISMFSCYENMKVEFKEYSFKIFGLFDNDFIEELVTKNLLDNSEKYFAGGNWYNKNLGIFGGGAFNLIDFSNNVEYTYSSNIRKYCFDINKISEYAFSEINLIYGDDKIIKEIKKDLNIVEQSENKNEIEEDSLEL